MNYTKQFLPNTSYRIYNYYTDRMEVLRINSRKGIWLNITLNNNKTMDVRVTQVTNPKAESLLLEDYCPIYSYEKEIKNEYD